MKLEKFSTQEEFNNASTSFIANFISKKPASIVALSGGSTPGPIYAQLAQQSSVNLNQAHFMQVDERYVPANHQDSNHKLITETLLSNKKIAKKNFHFFDTSLPIEKCLNKYEEEIKNLNHNISTSADTNLNDTTQLNHVLTILGIGPDGHTASLFPNSQALKESRFVAHTTTNRFAIKDRLTITFPVIMASETILVLMKGKSKETVLDELINSSKTIQEYPAKKLLEHRNLSIFFGDF